MLSAEEIIARALAVAGRLPRPAHFTNHTHCCECQDHDDELQPYTPADIPREALGTGGWDPITFTTLEGFRYFLPGLVRVVLTETGDRDYYDQFLWHVGMDQRWQERRDACTSEEREIVLAALEWLLEHRSQAFEDAMLADELLDALEKWSADADPGMPGPASR